MMTTTLARLVLVVSIVCIGMLRNGAAVAQGRLVCPPETYTRVNGNGTMECMPCHKCPEGFTPSIPCGLVTNNATSKRICIRCIKGKTFSSTNDFLPCKRCTTCRKGTRALTECSLVSDTVCGKCKRGYYFSVKTVICFPCSYCCGDSQDHVEDECAKQGLSRRKRCSIHSDYRCRPTSEAITSDIPSAYPSVMPSKTFPNSLENENKHELWVVPLTIVAAAAAATILFIVYRWFRLRSTPRKELSVLPVQLPQEDLPLISEVSTQVSDLNDCRSENDSNAGSYKFKLGITLHYDKFSKADSEKELAVEEFRDSDKRFMVNRETNQAFLSPIFQFYPNGETFVKPVKITLPHSAHVDSSNAWNIQVLCADLRKGEKVKWMGVEDDVVVEGKEVSFSTSTLLAYVVMGNLNAPGGSTKKHMQFAVFSSMEMIDNVFKAILYLFDDNETIFQRIQREEKKSGRKMLGSFYAAFIDCFDDKTIAVKIQGISAGWKLEKVVPGSIRTEQCANSYFDVPKWEATFRRVGPCDIKFQCTFAVDAAGKQINVPACVCLPEVFPSVYVGTVDVLGKDLPGSESLLRDLSLCVKAELCRTLDIPYRGVGSWRELGRALCLPSREVEVCSKQYSHVDGSPTTVLFEMLEAMMPQLTVGELVDVLKQLGRFDVVKILQGCDYKVSITN